MRHDIRATPDRLAVLHDVVRTAEDKAETKRHLRAVRQYREEREIAAEMEGEPWWIDLGEGESAP